jgi:hypothetical protein
MYLDPSPMQASRLMKTNQANSLQTTPGCFEEWRKILLETKKVFLIQVFGLFEQMILQKNILDVINLD